MVPEAWWTKPEWGKFSQVERQGPFLFFLQIHAVDMTALFWACAMGHVERWYVAGDVCASDTYDIIQVHVGSSLDELLSDLQIALLCCHHQGSLSILGRGEEGDTDWRARLLLDFEFLPDLIIVVK